MALAATRQMAIRIASTGAILLPLLLIGGSARAGLYAEQEGHYGVNTFTNYHNASGMGPRINPGQWVNVSCKVYDPYIQSVNPDGYWYQIADSPWNGQYYSPANTFMNGDPWDGPYTHNTDFNVPDCGSNPPPPQQPPPAPSPAAGLAQGPAAPVGYRFAITLDHFAANSGVSISCRDSASPGGFYSFTLNTDGSGHAFTQSWCYTNDGPDHWYIANGVESNHVSWGPRYVPPPTSTQLQQPQPPSNSGGAQPPTNSAPTPPENCNTYSGDFIHNGHAVWLDLHNHYLFGNGRQVVLDWSFFSTRSNFTSWAAQLGKNESRSFTAPKSDVDMYLSLRTFRVTRTSEHCYAIYDHYDFTPTDLARAAADLSFNPEKALTDLLFLPEWAYQLTGAREFNVYAAGKL